MLIYVYVILYFNTCIDAVEELDTKSVNESKLPDFINRSHRVVTETKEGNVNN